MKKITTCFLVLSTTLLLAAAPKPHEEVNGLVRRLEKENKPFRARAEEMQKLLAEPRVATNSYARLCGQKALVNWCRMTYYFHCWYYDHDLIKEIYPKVIPEALKGGYSDNDTLWFLEQYVKYFAVAEKYDEGIAMCWRAIGTLKPKHPRDTARLYLALAEMCRYADRYELAIAAAKSAMKYDVDAGAREGARLAGDWQREDVRREFISAMSAPCAAAYVCPVEGNRFRRACPTWIYRRLSDYVLCATNPAPARLTVYANAFSRDVSPLGEKMTDAMLALDDAAIADVQYRTDIMTGLAFANGNWARAARLYELSLKSKCRRGSMANPLWHRIYLTALDAGGRTADAIRVAAEYAADEKEKPFDRAVYAAFGNFFAGKDVEAALAPLGPKEKADALKFVGRCAMTVANAVGTTDAAEKLAKTYEGYFKPQPTRKMDVTFSAEPIRSISDWRKIHAVLPKGLCDIPFGEHMDLSGLVSDVNTKREVNLDASGKKVDITMEFTCVADRYALHLFLRTPDPQARDVEHGFVNGITTELYFAPGLDEPYICTGSNPLRGLTFMMNSQYDSIDYTCLERVEKGGRVKSEVEFSDTDYVLHLSMPWSDFYQKLPKAGKAGAEWKFDCIAWAPSGPKTWGGSRGIHHSSDWGHLVFNLTPAELTSIKREIILANYKTWSAPQGTGRGVLDRCEKWRRERVGDPAFYEACLKDYSAELKALQAKVNPKMDDATVNEVYEKGLIHWLGERYEIDRKRADYLGDLFLSDR